MEKLYLDACRTANAVIYGVDSTVDNSGNVTNRGRVKNSLVLEIKDRASAMLTSTIFSILTRELVSAYNDYDCISAFLIVPNGRLQLGYEVSMYKVPSSKWIAERMSSVRSGVCTPTHVYLETAVSYYNSFYIPYKNETSSVGSVGYSGLSGVYTTMDFIADGLNASKNSPTFSADFWRDYVQIGSVVDQLLVSALTNNSNFYPPAVSGCVNGRYGCINACSKTDTCTAREKSGSECMVVIMMYDSYDTAYVQAVFANLKIPSYFCFLSDQGSEGYVVDAQQRGLPVVFYHYQPDAFHYLHAGKFQRIYLPQPTAETVAVSTTTFGEHGYGGKTDNPVKVDFMPYEYQKYLATFISKLSPLSGLLMRFSLSQLEISELLQRYVNASVTADEHPYFTSACSWVQLNYETWSQWLDRLPICTIQDHIRYTLRGCDAHGNSTSYHHTIDFEWTFPDPENSSLPYNCDGGIIEVPDALSTSRSCSWLQNNYNVWSKWVLEKPVCDSSFYSYNTTDCDQPGAQRRTYFFWLLPDPANASLSLECVNDMILPEDMLFDCEYVPLHTKTFIVTLIFAAIIITGLVIAMILVYFYRSMPIIKRSQFQFLETMIFGGILVCSSTILYAGKPSPTLCSLRPSLISYGFTLIFGSLVVKSVRVYRVFLSSSLKRVVLSTFTMFKILSGFLLVDFVILCAWAIIDPPHPTMFMESVDGLGSNQVEMMRCSSSSFIFTALLIFWKAVVLFMGIYLSFAIRNVSTDFQESIWIFASALVVLFTSVLVLPAAYLLTTTAMFFFSFLAFFLLASTSLVMLFMLLPKFRRLRTVSIVSTSVGPKGTRGSSASTGEQESMASTRQPTKVSTSPAIWTSILLKRRMSATHVQPFLSSIGSNRKQKRQKRTNEAFESGIEA